MVRQLSFTPDSMEMLSVAWDGQHLLYRITVHSTIRLSIKGALPLVESSKTVVRVKEVIVTTMM